VPYNLADFGLLMFEEFPVIVFRVPSHRSTGPGSILGATGLSEEQ
jgi:hypothetical protein